MSTVDKITIKVDASALGLSSCSYRLKLLLVDGVHEKTHYNDTYFGSAFHSFTSKCAETGGNLALATMEAKKTFAFHNKVRDNKKHINELFLLKTCIDWWEQIGSNSDFQILLDAQGKPCVEIYFEHIIYEDEKVRIILCGTIDKIGQIKGGCYSIADYKTNSLYGSAKYGIPAFFKKYELSGQMMFYLHNTYLKGKQEPNSIIGEICKYPLGYRIDGVFIDSKQKTIFESSDVFIPSQEKKDEYAKLLNAKIQNIVKCVHEDYWPAEGLITGACTEGKFLCKYWQLCAARDATQRGHLIKANYVLKPYNPALHGTGE